MTANVTVPTVLGVLYSSCRLVLTRCMDYHLHFTKEVFGTLLKSQNIRLGFEPRLALEVIVLSTMSEK